jgi:hypothetical protein
MWWPGIEQVRLAAGRDTPAAAALRDVVAKLHLALGVPPIHRPAAGGAVDNVAPAP